MFRFRYVCFTFILRNDLPREGLVLNGALDERGVVLDHLLVPAAHIVCLDKVASVVEPTCSDVPTGSLQGMGQFFHLFVLFGLVGFHEISHNRCEGHPLETAEHGVEQSGFTS